MIADGKNGGRLADKCRQTSRNRRGAGEVGFGLVMVDGVKRGQSRAIGRTMSSFRERIPAHCVKSNA